MGGGLKESEVTIGYRYYLGMHLAICHGAVDAVLAIIAGDRVAWEGNITSSQQIYINSPELFGGEKKEGGVQGYVDVMMGESAQLQNDYLQTHLGATIPAFRGVLSLVLRHCYMTALTPYIKPWAVKVKRFAAPGWYDAKRDIWGGANPAHIIYECLTNTDWSMGFPSSVIDDGNFRDAADDLHFESLGLSFVFSEQSPTEDFIYTVLGHINGIIYQSPSTGLFRLKMLRNDYVIGSLPIFDESNILALEYFERPSYAEIVNEIVVVYRPQGAITDESVSVQNLAAVQVQGGVISQTVRYPGLDTAQNAAIIAARDLKQKSTPLARLRFKTNRTAWALSVGDVFRFSWDEHGIVLTVFRVFHIDYGVLDDGAITVTALEDVFALPSSVYVSPQSPLWIDPAASAPAAFPYRKIWEATYWDMYTGLPESEFALLDNLSCHLCASMGEPSTYIINYDLWTKPGGGTYALMGSGDACGHGTLVSTITPHQTTLLVTGLTAKSAYVPAGTYAIIENEVVRVDSVTIASGIVTVGRGCLDTVAASHPAGARIFFAEAARVRDYTEYTDGETVYAKALQRTPTGILPIGSAPEDSILLDARFTRPYPPGKLRLNGKAYPMEVEGQLTVSWAHRDRTVQLARPLIDETAGDVGPEAGVTYTVEVYATDGVTLLKTQTGITGTTWTWSDEPVPRVHHRNRVKLYSMRGGYTSWQIHDVWVNRDLSVYATLPIKFGAT